MCGLYHYIQRMCSISFITLTEIFYILSRRPKRPGAGGAGAWGGEGAEVEGK